MTWVLVLLAAAFIFYGVVDHLETKLLREDLDVMTLRIQALERALDKESK